MDVNILVNTFEQLKKYVFIIDRGKNNSSIVIKFTNDKFYHLVGLHKVNMEQFFPNYIKTKDKKYKYIKSHPDKFNNIFNNQLKKKYLLKMRISTFPKIIDLLQGNSSSLYDLKNKTRGKLYRGDFGLSEIYENDVCCLLGLIINDEIKNVINCVPNSWMASNRINKLVEFRRPIYMNKIIAIPLEMYDENLIYILNFKCIPN